MGRAPKRSALGIGLLVLALLLLAFPAVAQAVSYSTQELEFLELINEYRQQNGRSPLLLSDLASDASEKHSHDMATYNYFSHTTGSSDYFASGTTYLGRLQACGYTYNTYTGENIAAGQSSAQAVFTAWRNSSGHNTNMLNANYRVIGIGYEYRSGSTYGHYWTTDFGGYVDPTAHDPGGGGGGPGDTTAPVVDITAPADGATVSGTVQIRIDATDEVGVTKVELRIDGSLAGTDSGYPYGFDWVTGVSNNGQRTLQARAYDAAGNTANDQITVTVANAAPTTTTLAPTTTTTRPPTTTTLAPTTTTTRPPTTTTPSVSAPPPTTTTTTRPPATTTTTRPPTTTTRPTTTSTTKPPTATTNPPTTSTTVAATTFDDVPAGHPYAEEISLLASRSIVLGRGDGRFYPDSPVVRQQFAKMIVLSLQLPVSESDTPPFDDVDRPLDDLYPDNYVAVCAAEGITVGTGTRRFSPWDSITRAQLITMVARAAGLPEPPAGYDPSFEDFSPTHYPWARRAAYAGVLVGLEGMGRDYDFWAPATRGEVCALLEELLDDK